MTKAPSTECPFPGLYHNILGFFSFFFLLFLFLSFLTFFSFFFLFFFQTSLGFVLPLVFYYGIPSNYGRSSFPFPSSPLPPFSSLPLQKHKTKMIPDKPVAPLSYSFLSLLTVLFFTGFSLFSHVPPSFLFFFSLSCFFFPSPSFSLSSLFFPSPPLFLPF